MKHIVYILGFVAILFTACKDTEDTSTKECGEEAITSVAIYNCNDLFASDSVLTDGKNTTEYKYSSEILGTMRNFSLTTTYNALCTYTSPVISASLELAIADPEIADTLFISESGGNVVYYIPDNFGTLHHGSEFYTWQNEGSGAASLFFAYAVYFPTLGDWPSDSAYFFTNLIKMSLGMSGDKQK